MSTERLQIRCAVAARVRALRPKRFPACTARAVRNSGSRSVVRSGCRWRLASLCWRRIVALLLLAAAGCGSPAEDRAAEEVSSPVGRRTETAAAAPAVPIALTDVTAEAGIRFIHNTGAFGEKYLPETLGAGAIWLDANGDGRQDLLLINSTDWPGRGAGTPPALYRNEGGWSFTDVTRSPDSTSRSTASAARRPTTTTTVT